MLRLLHLQAVQHSIVGSVEHRGIRHAHPAPCSCISTGNDVRPTACTALLVTHDHEALRAMPQYAADKADDAACSGGQRKRVNIGLELVARPSLLFMDEPTSGVSALACLW